jgi:flagellar protein FlgJ
VVQQTALNINQPVIAGDFSGAIKPHNLQQAAEQFEAVFLRDMLKQMRQATDVLLDKEGIFNSKQERMMRGYYDDVLSSSLAKQHQVGIAEMLIRQLSPKQSISSS